MNHDSSLLFPASVLTKIPSIVPLPVSRNAQASRSELLRNIAIYVDEPRDQHPHFDTVEIGPGRAEYVHLRRARCVLVKLVVHNRHHHGVYTEPRARFEGAR